MRAKVCAVDWFGTGRLDLLVGDFATQKPDRPEPTPKEKAEQDKARAELDEVMKSYRIAVDKMVGAEPAQGQGGARKGGEGVFENS